jgi:prepilin-type N-terminal cleavage/methylation domain-containing protein/prepilin-type processing-associated H-X9-DG protein
MKFHSKTVCQNAGFGALAFTLIELLVVIAIIGILAGILLPVLANGKSKGHQTACGNNFHQIAIAFQLYEDDSSGQFPTPGSKTTYGPQPEDWIWWQYGRGLENGSIVKYLSAFNPVLFTCPADSDAKMLQTMGYLVDEPYRYSYSLTSYNLTKTSAGIRINPGMSTIITQDRHIYPFTVTQIKSPSNKIMLVEEYRQNINDVININDPRWVPGINKLTSRHIGRANVTFADGHIDAVLPQVGMDTNNSAPLF